MKKSLLSIMAIVSCCIVLHAQQAPKREVRGTWIATYANIDWPRSRTEPVPLQRAALVAILDHHQATGINVIYFQIRSQCDAMYASAIEPWSADMTGTQGKAPTELSIMDPSGTKIWDPLKFIIEECHRRGMELHAWMNPYRAINNFNVINTFSPTHVARAHPEWLLSQGTLRILDPGIPAAQAHIKRVVSDVVSRYDLDGIHFDDYFYPPQAAAGVTPYNDDVTFNADPRGFTDRGDWRRDNVNRFIKSVSDTLKILKPWVEFGVSPSGIYRNSTNPAIGSNTTGLQHYVTLFADTRKWLQEGWIDYLAPQVYWYIGQPGANYSIIVPWWNNNSFGRHIYIGMAGYKVNDPLQGVNWANPSMIPSEVRLNRTNANVYGQAVYNTSSLTATTRLGFRDSLRLNFYKYPALQPRMPWRDDVAPDPASELVAVQHGGDSVVLDWTAPTYVTNEFDQVKRFVIYRSESAAIDFNNPANIVAITPSPMTHFKDTHLPKDTTYYYAVTSLDRFHNESIPSNTTDYLAPVIACAQNQQLQMDVNCEVLIPDYTALATVSDDVTPASSITVVQSPAAGTVLSLPSTTEITFTATDGAGKSSSCSFMLITLDKLAPVITSSPDDITVSTGVNGTTCSVAVSWEEPVATDNCTMPLIYSSRTHSPGDVFTVGTTSVTYVFKDAAGNADSTSFNIVVLDDTKPVVVTKNITRALAVGEVTITADDINNGSSDNCGIGSITASATTFTCADIGQHPVTLTVVDVHGNENTATAIVTITGSIPQPTINITRTDNTYTGLPSNTIALGYGAQAVTLSVLNAFGSSPSSYAWSPASGLTNTNGSSTVFAPTTEGTFTFTVTVTNEFGCSATAQTTVYVIDVRCGKKDKKVQVCMSLGHHPVEVCVAPAAVPALLWLNGELGSCNTNELVAQEETVQTSVFSAYPNPFSQLINIQFKLPVADNHVRVDLYDVNGISVKKVFEGSAESGAIQNFIVPGHELRGGVFIARMITSSGKSYSVKVIRQE